MLIQTTLYKFCASEVIFGLPSIWKDQTRKFENQGYVETLGAL